MDLEGEKKLLRSSVTTKAWVFLVVFAAGWICGFFARGWFA